MRKVPRVEWGSERDFPAIKPLLVDSAGGCGNIALTFVTSRAPSTASADYLLA